MKFVLFFSKHFHNFLQINRNEIIVHGEFFFMALIKAEGTGKHLVYDVCLFVMI